MSQLDEPNTRTYLQMHSKDEAAFALALEKAAAHRAKVKFDAEQAFRKWTLESNVREQENGLPQRLGKNAGRIDDTYFAEVPLTIGWNSYQDGTSLAYVSLGGVDVTAYLPPAVLADIRSHVDMSFDDEMGVTA